MRSESSLILQKDQHTGWCINPLRNYSSLAEFKRRPLYWFSFSKADFNFGWEDFISAFGRYYLFAEYQAPKGKIRTRNERNKFEAKKEKRKGSTVCFPNTRKSIDWSWKYFPNPPTFPEYKNLHYCHNQLFRQEEYKPCIPFQISEVENDMPLHQEHQY